MPQKDKVKTMNNSKNRYHAWLVIGAVALAILGGTQTVFAQKEPPPAQADKSDQGIKSAVETGFDALDPTVDIKKLVKLTAKQQKSLDASMEKRGPEIVGYMDKMGDRLGKDIEGITGKILKKYDAEIKAIGALPEAEQKAKTDALTKKAFGEMLPPVLVPYRKGLTTQIRTTMTKVFADMDPLMTTKQKPLLAAAKKKYFVRFDKEVVAAVNTIFDEIIKGVNESLSEEEPSAPKEGDKKGDGDGNN
jgi:hypothetical protein